MSPRPVPRRYERPAAELERIAAELRELGRDGTSATAPGCSVSSALIDLSLAAEDAAEMIEALADEEDP